MKDMNRGKTVELGVIGTPIKPLTLTGSYYGGQESSGTGVTGRRDSTNFVASYNVIEPLSLGLEYLRVQQKDAIFDATGTPAKGKYSGLALYAAYTVTPKLKGTPRRQTVDAKHGND